MTGARAEVLARIRTALAGVPSDEPDHWPGPGPPGSPDAYELGPADGAPPAVERFAERVADYRADVVRCAAADVGVVVADVLRRHEATTMAVAAGVSAAWRTAAVAWREDPPTAAALDAVDGVLSAAALAIAETGTLVLDHGPDQGRRALTLVPDLHVCVIAGTQVVATVPEAVRRLRPRAAAGAPITLVSGPSATSDIELVRVEGVHGPRRLVVVLTS